MSLQRKIVHYIKPHVVDYFTYRARKWLPAECGTRVKEDRGNYSSISSDVTCAVCCRRLARAVVSSITDDETLRLASVAQVIFDDL